MVVGYNILQNAIRPTFCTLFEMTKQQTKCIDSQQENQERGLKVIVREADCEKYNWSSHSCWPKGSYATNSFFFLMEKRANARFFAASISLMYLGEKRTSIF